MVVRQAREFVDGHPFRQRRDDLVDQLAADRPDARTAKISPDCGSVKSFT
jgi:hypothetical protein